MMSTSDVGSSEDICLDDYRSVRVDSIESGLILSGNEREATQPHVAIKIETETKNDELKHARIRFANDVINRIQLLPDVQD